MAYIIGNIIVWVIFIIYNKIYYYPLEVFILNVLTFYTFPLFLLGIIFYAYEENSFFDCKRFLKIFANGPTNSVLNDGQKKF